jgi:hypothetical protein
MVTMRAKRHLRFSTLRPFALFSERHLQEEGYVSVMYNSNFFVKDQKISLGETSRVSKSPKSDVDRSLFLKARVTVRCP